MVGLAKLKAVARIKAVLYTGDGSTDREVSLGFRPDVFWIYPKLHLESLVQGADADGRTPEYDTPALMEDADHLTSNGVNVGKVHNFLGKGNVSGVTYILFGISE